MLEVTPVREDFVAEIAGVDLCAPPTPEIARELRAALDQYGVLQAPKPVDAVRIAGALLVLTGVVLVVAPWRAQAQKAPGTAAAASTDSRSAPWALGAPRDSTRVRRRSAGRSTP